MNVKKNIKVDIKNRESELEFKQIWLNIPVILYIALYMYVFILTGFTKLNRSEKIKTNKTYLPNVLASEKDRFEEKQSSKIN